MWHNCNVIETKVASVIINIDVFVKNIYSFQYAVFYTYVNKLISSRLRD